MSMDATVDIDLDAVVQVCFPQMRYTQECHCHGEGANCGTRLKNYGTRTAVEVL